MRRLHQPGGYDVASFCCVFVCNLIHFDAGRETRMEKKYELNVIMRYGLGRTKQMRRGGE